MQIKYAPTIKPKAELSDTTAEVLCEVFAQFDHETFTMKDLTKICNGNQSKAQMHLREGLKKFVVLKVERNTYVIA